jgi:hypothetical protein
MEDLIIQEAKDIYLQNSGNLSINQCVRLSLRKHNSFASRMDALDRYLLFQITEKEYIKYLEEKVSDSLLWRE